MTSTVPPRRGLSASLPRHFVPGYYQPVPPGQNCIATQAVRAWLLSACPSGTKIAFALGTDIVVGKESSKFLSQVCPAYLP
jgi:hypothetical protein